MDRQIRLIGIDLDGTLLTRQKELTAASRRALTDAIVLVKNGAIRAEEN